MNDLINYLEEAFKISKTSYNRALSVKQVAQAIIDISKISTVPPTITRSALASIAFSKKKLGLVGKNDLSFLEKLVSQEELRIAKAYSELTCTSEELFTKQKVALSSGATIDGDILDVLRFVDSLFGYASELPKNVHIKLTTKKKQGQLQDLEKKLARAKLRLLRHDDVNVNPQDVQILLYISTIAGRQSDSKSALNYLDSAGKPATKLIDSDEANQIINGFYAQLVSYDIQNLEQLQKIDAGTYSLSFDFK